MDQPLYKDEPYNPSQNPGYPSQPPQYQNPGYTAQPDQYVDISGPSDRSFVEERSMLAKNIQRGYHFGIIALAFINFIAGWMAYSSVTSHSNSIMDFKANWELKPIGKLDRDLFL